MSFKTFLCSVFGFIVQCETSAFEASGGLVTLEYGAGYYLNMDIIIVDIPKGVNNATLYWKLTDGSQLLIQHQTVSVKTIFTIDIRPFEIGGLSNKEKYMTLFTGLSYPDGKFCGEVPLARFIFNYENDPTLNECFDPENGCKIKFSWKNQCKNSTDQHTTIQGTAPVSVNKDIKISYSSNRTCNLSAERRKLITEEFKNKFSNVKMDMCCYKTNDIVDFTCNTAETSKIQWLHQVSGNNNNTYVIENDTFSPINSSVLTIKLVKYDNFTILFCMSKKPQTSPGNEIKSSAYALINIDDERPDDYNEVGLEISYSEHLVSINHTCMDKELHGITYAKYYKNGEIELSVKNYSKYKMKENSIELFCMGYKSFKFTYLGETKSRYERITFNRKKYVIKDGKGANSLHMPLVVGIPAALLIVAVLCVLAWCLIRAAKRRPKPSNVGLDLVIYSTTNEIQYAELSMAKSASSGLSKREDMEPYAEIVGFLEAKTK